MSAPGDADAARARLTARAARLRAHINGAHADGVVARARDAGHFLLARSYRPWLATAEIQDAIGHFAQAVAAYSLDHLDDFVDALACAYNCPRYFDDGCEVAVTARRPGERGLRLDLDFIRRDTGARTLVRDLTTHELFRAAADMLAPDKVLARGLLAVNSSDPRDVGAEPELASRARGADLDPRAHASGVSRSSPPSAEGRGAR